MATACSGPTRADRRNEGPQSIPGGRAEAVIPTHRGGPARTPNVLIQRRFPSSAGYNLNEALTLGLLRLAQSWICPTPPTRIRRPAEPRRVSAVRLNLGGIPRGGLVDRKQRSNIRASVTASLADEQGLEGKPDVIRPLVAADHCRMAATIIRAIDQQTARARCAHCFFHFLLRASRGG